MADQKKAVFRRPYSLALGTLVGFHAIANVVWILLNTAPPAFDSSFHTVLAMRYAHRLQMNPLSFLDQSFLQITNYYPPVTYWVGMFFVWLFNYDYQLVQIIGTFFFLITIVALYLYIKETFGSERIAFFSAFFFSFFLTVVQESRLMMTDIPSTAAILFSMYFLHKSELLRLPAMAFLYFFFAGLALLTRWTAIVFLLVPIVITAVQAFRTGGKTAARFCIAVVLGALVVFAICAPWYFTNVQTVIEIARTSSTAEADDPQSLLSFENFLYYPKVVSQFQIFTAGTLFFIGVLVWLGRRAIRKRFRFHSAILTHPLTIPFLMIVFSYLVFTFGFANKNIRYVLPIMPFVAVFMAYGLHRALTERHNQALSWIAVFMIFFYIGSYSITSFGFPIQPNFKYVVNLPVLGYQDVLYLDRYPVDAYFSRENWPNRELADIIIRESEGDDFFRFLVLMEKPKLNAATVTLALYRAFRGVPGIIFEADTNFAGRLQGRKMFTNEELNEYIQQHDIVIAPEKIIGSPSAVRDIMVREQMQMALKTGFINKYEVIKKLPSPDGDTILVYKKRSCNNLLPGSCRN